MEHSLIRALILEDVAVDAEMACDALRTAGLKLEVCIAAEEADYLAALASFEPDVILADYALPRYDGLSAMAVRRSMAPQVPFIFVTGSLGEERAVEMLRLGATDYVLKQNLSRLPLVVLRALAESDAMRDQVRMQKQLDHERELLSAVLSTTGALIIVLDRQGVITRLNPAAEQVIGALTVNVTGRPYWSILAAENEYELVRQSFSQLQARENGEQVRWRTSLPSGRIVIWSVGRLPDQTDRNDYAVLAGIDVTDQEKAEQQAYYLRHYDSLTGLPNRELLQQRLSRLRSDTAGPITLVLIGIARLHDVRDSLGDETANHLLREVARRLSGWHQAGDWVARVGDDSFAMILAFPNDSELTGHMRRLLEQMRSPYRLGNREFFLNAYIGIADHEPDAEPAESLRSAETALHRAELEQGEGFHLYQPKLSNEAHERLALEAELHEALAGDGQLELYYQPQAEIASGRIVGLEALVRWRHPRHGLVLPAAFIPLAESCGMIVQLGERVLDMACKQAAEWQRMGLPPVTVAVNLAAAQWARPDLIKTVEQALTRNKLAPQWLELELTETDSMQDPTATVATMEQLRRMGVHMSIDDFGTGYCNLNYLKRFPVNKLKIDRSFVSDITTVPDDLAISRTVIAIAHQLRLKVVAEGVETEGQLALLAEAGCDLIQGYYFSRPLPVDVCAELLSNRTMLTTDRRKHHQNTLLIVDDESNVLSSLRRLLRVTDYHVLTTSSPFEAFELLATHEAGVILSDQRMPELNGTEFLNRVKDMYPDTVRMILSGYTDLQTVTDAVNRGAIYKFLTKPWEDKALLATLADAFDKYHADTR